MRRPYQSIFTCLTQNISGLLGLQVHSPFGIQNSMSRAFTLRVLSASLVSLQEGPAPAGRGQLAALVWDATPWSALTSPKVSSEDSLCREMPF